MLLLERKGARIGVITTQGFRDVLEMRRRDRPRTWGLRGNFEPVVARELRIEGARAPHSPTARSSRWSISTPCARRASNCCCRAARLWPCSLSIPTPIRPMNRRRWRLFAPSGPNPHVSASSEILPEIREYERFSTTALNAYLQPEVAGYLGRLAGALDEGGFGGEFLIVQSNGGVMAVDTACSLPVRTALSGPAAGVIAAGIHRAECRFSQCDHR